MPKQSLVHIYLFIHTARKSRRPAAPPCNLAASTPPLHTHPAPPSLASLIPLHTQPTPPFPPPPYVTAGRGSSARTSATRRDTHDDAGAVVCGRACAPACGEQGRGVASAKWRDTWRQSRALSNLGVGLRKRSTALGNGTPPCVYALYTPS